MSRLHRLTGSDDFFLLVETPGQPMHYVTLMILRPESGGGSPLDLEGLAIFLRARLPRVPALRWRIKPVPMGLQQPVAFDDPDFELSRHLEAVTLPAPGGPEELDALVARVSEVPLDRSRPLWKLTIAGGLGDGRQALLLQVHHALMDGVAALNVLAVLFSAADPAHPADLGDPGYPGAEPAKPGREPGGLRLLLGAVATGVRKNFRLPGLVWRSLRGFGRVKARRNASPVKVPVPGKDTPACAINCPPGAGRRFARAYLPLAEVKAVKNAVPPSGSTSGLTSASGPADASGPVSAPGANGASGLAGASSPADGPGLADASGPAGRTVNDVALALCAGALQEYLEVRGQLPAPSLVAAIPVGIDTADRTRLSGNRWSGLATTLATDITDPWQRLLAISAVTRESKLQLGLMGVSLLEDWVDFIPPFMAKAAVAKERRDAADPNNVRYNLSLSNLRGPAQPLAVEVHSARWQIEEIFLTAVPANRQGLSIVCMDLGDQLTFGIFSAADSVGDPTELVGGLHRALAELVKATEGLPPAPAPAITVT